MPEENKEEECPHCDVHSHCSLHDPELFEDMMDTPQTPMPHTNEEMEKRFDERYKRKMLGETLGYDIAHQKDLKHFINQEISDLKKSIREEIERFPVYYRSKFSQDCSREETHDEKNTEMIERSLVLEILSLKSLE